ncbi:MAG: dimethyl sulfoxide reductase anchor subunit [Gammaproteobacteria bacterium]|nr:dimethyl sulfoxide reductase anchor subunit [Gammaproteobacteria bacterium]
MFKRRDDEPDYAILPEVDAPQVNRYGKKIQLVDETDALAGKSLNINGDSSVGDNPNRYKQHGFYFNADNCISCHACESACSEKNDLPSHIAFRSVGYVEGGTWPAYRRMNISMACNHCDDPVCLKGCPTRAYTKFAEYGAVLQDPDICFGCGYCTWVCPYNAPQLDLAAGHVQKCNMCVDRLEVGLKPACSSACLAGALDFGVIETTPENREQLEVKIPGFPSPEITHPNIRFQQKKSLPSEMRRTDAMPLTYERDDTGRSDFIPEVDERKIEADKGLAGLSSREDPLVIFTLVSQMVVGAVLALILGPVFGLEVLSPDTHPVAYSVMLFGLLGLETLALVLSTMHLGKPHRFYRAFNNLRYSPVSREVASIAVFYNLLGAYALLLTFPGLFFFLPDGWVDSLVGMTGIAAAVTGPIALYFMHKIYRIKARPFWNHWQVLTSFYGNMLALGGLVTGLYFGFIQAWQGLPSMTVMDALALPVLLGLLMEAIGLYYHANDLKATGGEGAASHFRQLTAHGRSYRARNIALAGALLLVTLLTATDALTGLGLYSWILVAIAIFVSAVLGRALFYVLVIPTTMPGAFFWRNQGFQEHAQQSGLAEMPQVGVLNKTH